MDELRAQIAELTRRLDERDAQQLQAPLDDVSKAVLGAAVGSGPGSAMLTQSIAVAGGSITVPAAYQGTRVLIIDGVQYIIPYLDTA